jgi:hypothetical protein
MVSTLSPARRRGILWFAEHAGYIVGKRLEGSKALYDAEQTAKAAGCYWEWVDDPDGAPRRGDEHFGKVEYSESCTLRDDNGEWLASLGGIWDADDNYRRVIQAELALEALDALQSYDI